MREPSVSASIYLDTYLHTRTGERRAQSIGVGARPSSAGQHPSIHTYIHTVQYSTALAAHESEPSALHALHCLLRAQWLGTGGGVLLHCLRGMGRRLDGPIWRLAWRGVACSVVVVRRRARA